ncbi:hypothetical protein STEG23_003091, partial [Scotinomys teguina]
EKMTEGWDEDGAEKMSKSHVRTGWQAFIFITKRQRDNVVRLATATRLLATATAAATTVATAATAATTAATASTAATTAATASRALVSVVERSSGPVVAQAAATTPRAAAAPRTGTTAAPRSQATAGRDRLATATRLLATATAAATTVATAATAATTAATASTAATTAATASRALVSVVERSSGPVVAQAAATTPRAAAAPRTGTTAAPRSQATAGRDRKKMTEGWDEDGAEKMSKSHVRTGWQAFIFITKRQRDNVVSIHCCHHCTASRALVSVNLGPVVAQAATTTPELAAPELEPQQPQIPGYSRKRQDRSDPIWIPERLVRRVQETPRRQDEVSDADDAPVHPIAGTE